MKRGVCSFWFRACCHYANGTIFEANFRLFSPLPTPRPSGSQEGSGGNRRKFDQKACHLRSGNTINKIHVIVKRFTLKFRISDFAVQVLPRNLRTSQSNKRPLSSMRPRVQFTYKNQNLRHGFVKLGRDMFAKVEAR